MNSTAILINVRDRPSELGLLLQSLRTQTRKDFDIFILDDQSGTPIPSFHFINCLINRLKLENHKVYLRTSEFPLGVSKARQAIVDWALNTDKYEYLCRVDDDVVLEPNYLEELWEVIAAGYDLASGVTVPMAGPSLKRESKYLEGVANRVILAEDGTYIFNGDSCGMGYMDKVIIPAHHFRSCALYKSAIHEKVNYLPTRFSKHGFREEQIFSYKILLAGFKIGVNTAAVNYHQMTPSGGERFSDSNELIRFNQGILEEYTKENKDALRALFPNEPMPSALRLQKEDNLASLK